MESIPGNQCFYGKNHFAVIQVYRRVSILFKTVLILFMAAVVCRSQDTLKVYRVPGVTVTAPAPPGSIGSSSFSESKVTISDSAGTEGKSFSEILSLAGGIFVKDYGGLSQLKTISLRGLSSEHTLVLLNGLPLNTSQNGLADLSVIPIDGAASLYVTRGGQSAEYGGNAIGGTVNIVTPQTPGDSRTGVDFSAGSFGQQDAKATADIRLTDGMLATGFVVRHADDNYPFNFNNGPSAARLLRTNSDVTSRAGYFQYIHSGDDDGEISATGSFYGSERGVGGAVTGIYSISQARQSDQDHLVQLHYETGSNALYRFDASAQVHYASEQYSDPGYVIGGKPLEDDYQNVDMQFRSQFSIGVGGGSRLVTIGLEAVHSAGTGNSLMVSPVRNQMGTFVTGMERLSTGWNLFPSLSFTQALRLDLTGSFDPTLSPQGGFILRSSEGNFGSIKGLQAAFRGSISRDFRLPTFNELYYNVGGGIGNPNLAPEKAFSLETGVELQFLFLGKQRISGTFYNILMNNRIIWVPAGGINVMPENLRKVRSQGVELAYQWNSPSDYVALDIHYNLGEAKKISEDFPGDPAENSQLAFIPQETGAATVTLQKPGIYSWLNRLAGFVKVNYSSFRYLTETNDQFLPSYVVMGGGVIIDFRWQDYAGTFEVDADNILNQNYQVMQAYPMPLRSFVAHIGLKRNL